MGRTVTEAFYEWVQEMHRNDTEYPLCENCGEVMQEWGYVDQYGDRWCDECLYNHRVPLIGKVTCKRCGYTIESCDQRNIVMMEDEFTCDECLVDGRKKW